MKQSQLFTKTTKNIDSEELSLNAQLLTKAGFVHKEMAGVYAFLPLGLRVINKIITIIRKEMNAIGGQELLMNTLQRKELWTKTNHWDDKEVDVWFKTELKNGTEIGLAWSHEEQVTDIMKRFINSYKDLPVYAYQVQTKFRNETRAKSGIMRTREFIMKDLYSFSKNLEEHNEFYNKAREAYNSIFKQCGIGDTTYLTFASGGAFSEFSHEFQTITDSGEDHIYIDEEKNIAINKEVLNDAVLANLGISKNSLIEKKASEVGNIFTLATKFSEPLKLMYTAQDGSKSPVFMGCYGIGPARVMGVVAETHSDEKGLVWPLSIAPYHVHILALGEDPSIISACDELSRTLESKGIEVLFDDRDEGPGVKLNDADLIGIPVRIIIGSKTIASHSCEVKLRKDSEAQLLPIQKAADYVLSLLK